jgi:hypothetical protein
MEPSLVYSFDQFKKLALRSVPGQISDREKHFDAVIHGF